MEAIFLQFRPVNVKVKVKPNANIRHFLHVSEMELVSQTFAP